MTRILKFKRSVQGDLKKIGKETTREVMKEIRKDLLPNPKSGKPLKGKDGTLWSYRAGDHGIIYIFNDNDLYVLFIRGRAYL